MKELCRALIDYFASENIHVIDTKHIEQQV